MWKIVLMSVVGGNACRPLATTPLSGTCVTGNSVCRETPVLLVSVPPMSLCIFLANPLLLRGFARTQALTGTVCDVTTYDMTRWAGQRAPLTHRHGVLRA